MDVYWLLGMPCSGKTTQAQLLAKKYALDIISGDALRTACVRQAREKCLPYVSMDTTDFLHWEVERIADWERGVMREITGACIREVLSAEAKGANVLFEGVLDIPTLLAAEPACKAIYLCVDPEYAMRNFYLRDDHMAMYNAIMSHEDMPYGQCFQHAMARCEAAIAAFGPQGVPESMVLHRTAQDTPATLFRKLEKSLGFV